MINIKPYWYLIWFLLLPAYAEAASQGVEKFEHYEVHYSIFNSSLLSPKIATHYGLTRGDDKALVNIVVLPNQATSTQSSALGIAVILSGSYRNLMQQGWPLNFQTITEGDAIYYLAEFDFDHREQLNFEVHVKSVTDQYANSLKFSHQLYQDSRQ